MLQCIAVSDAFPHQEILRIPRERSQIYRPAAVFATIERRYPSIDLLLARKQLPRHGRGLGALQNDVRTVGQEFPKKYIAEGTGRNGALEVALNLRQRRQKYGRRDTRQPPEWKARFMTLQDGKTAHERSKVRHR